MNFFKKEVKKNRSSKRKPSNSDIKDAKELGIELGKNWNSYSKETRIHVYVKNMQEMVRFYNKILEFPVVKVWRLSDGDGTIINLGGNNLELYSKNRRHNYHSDFSGCVSFSIRVKNVHKLYEKFSKKNIKIEEIQKNSWGDSSFSLRDPEGNRITFFSPDINLDSYYKIRT